MYLSTVTSTIPEGRIDPLYIALASRTTYVVCVNFIREWRDLQFNIDSEGQIFFEKHFHGKFYFNAQSFYQKSGERKSPKNYFFSYSVLMSDLEYEPGLYV